MALQSSGQISIGDLKTEFGDTGSSSLSEFYRGGSLVPDTGTNAGVPTSGQIKLSDFYGASAVVSSWAWVTTYSSMNEGVTRTFQFEDTNGLITSGTFTWSINGTTDDFNSVGDTGTISATSQGSFSITTKNDSYTDGNEDYTITVSYGGSTILTQALTVVDTSLTPSYTLTPSVSSVNEGGSFTITFTTNQSGSFGYTISGVSSADINGASLTGSVTNNDVLTFNVTEDATTEGSETFNIALDNNQASTSVTINDTSTSPPTYNFSPESYNVTEGNSVTITVSTTDVPNGTTLYWRLASDPGNDIVTDSGSFTINSNTGTFSVSATFDSAYTESTETLTLQLSNLSDYSVIEAEADLNIINVGAPSVSSGTTSYFTDVSANSSGAQLLVNAYTSISVTSSSSGITVQLDGDETGDGTFTASTTNSGSAVTAYTVTAPGSNISEWKLTATSVPTPSYTSAAGTDYYTDPSGISDNTYYSAGSSGSTYMYVQAEVEAASAPTYEAIDWTIGVALYFKDSFNTEYGPYSLSLRARAQAQN